MKKNSWMIMGLLASASVFAQQQAGAPAAAPVVSTGTNVTAPAAPKPAAKSSKPAKKKTEAAKPARVEKPIVLVPGPATVTGDNVNVRGRASFVGEVLARLKKGDNVTVIEQVLLAKPKADEPSQWAKVGYPKGVNVWVHSAFIEPTNSAVKPKRLNMRGGPGENYSVVGILAQGEAVKEVSRKGVWMEIEAPEKAYAFLAAEYLKQDVTAPAVPPVVSIPLESTTVSDENQVIVPPVDTPNTNEVTTTSATNPEETEVPPPPRIVSHEGIVRPTISIQAPTQYEIWDPKSRMTINYLHSTSSNLDLSLYKGLRIVVTGEEGLDERWKTPVITIQRIQVVE